MASAAPIQIQNIWILFIVLIVYIYLYKIERKAYIGMWSCGWGAILAAHLFTIVLNPFNLNQIQVVLNQLSLLVSTAFILKGTYLFFNKKTPESYLVIFAFNFLWVIATGLSSFPLWIVATPPTIWAGLVYIGFGRVILKKWADVKLASRMLGFSLIAWGLHSIDYPILAASEKGLVWGFTLASGMQIMVALSFLLVYFERARLSLQNTKETLLQNERRLAGIVRNQRDVLFEIDKNKRFIFVSPSCYYTLGLNAAQLAGRSMEEVFNCELLFKGETEEGADNSIEVKWEGNEEKLIYLSIAFQNRYNLKNEFVGAIGSIRDITKHKQLEEALQYDKVKTEFFSNISHELRTPLNVILATVQLLQLYKKNNDIAGKDDKIDKYLYTMKQNSYRLIRLFNNLIDISKLEAGFFEISPVNHDIVSIVEDITLSIVQYTESKDIELLFDTDVEEMVIACDPDKIERIILNLLSNSIKFTPNGGQVLVNIHASEKSIYISVKDNGIGIPKDKLDFIFQRFRQVDKSLSRSNEGSGIGLSLVKSLVELHEGSISVNSEYSKGSEFIIELPNRLVEKQIHEKTEGLSNNKVEKISIEFSDIYSA